MEPADPGAAATAASLTTEEKRSRQREHAKRSYYKRVKAMAALKAERELLEQQYRDALAASTTAAASSPTSPGCGAQSNDEPESELVDRIMELSVARDELRSENEALKTAVARFFTLQRRLQQSLEDMDSDSDPPTPTLVADAVVATVLAQQFERVMLTTPLTSAACRMLNQQSYDEMVAFVAGSNAGADVSAAAGTTSLCGWREFRGAHSGRFRFSTRKVFPHHSATDLADRTWATLSTAELLKELYSSSISIQLDVVQRVDADNVVFYRTMQIPNSTRVSKTLLLVSRFVDASANTVVLLRSLDRSLLQSVVSAASPDLLALVTAAASESSANSSDWMEVFSWAVFSATGKHNDGCAMEFGGFVRHTTREASEFWMLEALLISLRWESRVVAPVFSVV